MKYIRTKDGIYWNILDGVLSPQTWIGNPIAEADTIEELCDEFVSVDNYGNKSIGNDFELAKAKYKILNAGAVKMLNGDVFGAIWTEWGLKYVAKMNDKGELELL